MTDTIKEQSVQVLFRVEKRLVPADGEEAPVPVEQRAPANSSTSTGTGNSGMTMNMGALSYSGPSEDGSAATKKATAKSTKPEDDGGTFPGTAKNAPCPCGSGKKYKMCHGKNEAA